MKMMVMKVKPTAYIFFLECASESIRLINKVKIKRLHGLNPSTKAIKKVNKGRGKVKPSCWIVFEEIFLVKK